MPVTFGTFHGIYYGILKWAYGLDVGQYHGGGGEDGSCCGRSLSRPQMSPDMEIEDEKDYLGAAPVRESGKSKTAGSGSAQYESQVSPRHFQDICTLYENKKKQMKKIDFDDMLLLCWKLFKTRSDISGEMAGEVPLYPCG